MGTGAGSLSSRPRRVGEERKNKWPAERKMRGSYPLFSKQETAAHSGTGGRGYGDDIPISLLICADGNSSRWGEAGLNLLSDTLSHHTRAAVFPQIKPALLMRRYVLSRSRTFSDTSTREGSRSAMSPRQHSVLLYYHECIFDESKARYEGAAWACL